MLYSLPVTQNPLFGPRTYKRRRGLGFLGGLVTLYKDPQGHVTAFTDSAGNSYSASSYPADSGQFEQLLQNIGNMPTQVVFGSLPGPTPAQPAAPVEAALVIPPGYVPFTASMLDNWKRNTYSAGQWTSATPVNHPDGTTSLDGSFNTDFPNFDSNRINAGGYAYQDQTLGDIMSSAGRRYQLIKRHFIDVATGVGIGDYYTTIEGGGSGTLLNTATKDVSNFVAPIAAPLVQALTDAGTGGVSELVGLVDKNAQRQTEAVVGGSAVGAGVGAVTGAITGSVGGPAGTVAGAIAGAIGGGISGTVEGISVATSDRPSSDVVGGAVVGGGIAGVVAGAGVDIYNATGAVPPPSAMGPVTVTPETAGSTLLPPSLSIVPPTAPPPVFSLPPVVAPIQADFAAPPLDHLPLPPAPQNYAGSTLLPPNLSLIEPPPTTYYGFNPVVPIPFTPPAPSTFVYNPGIDQAGSTLSPPSLSVVDQPPTPVGDFGTVPVPGTTPGLLSDIVNAGKVGIPGAISGYQIFKKLTTPDAGAASGGNSYSFVGDPNAPQPTTTAPKKSYAAPILAGGALLLLLAAKAKRHHG